MSVRLRSASPGDAEDLVVVHHAAVEALPGTHYTRAERDAWINFVTEEAMREGLSASDTTTFVAETDEHVVGFSTLQGREVRAVYVRPEVQGRGIGSDLLGAVEERAAARDLQTLTVSASLNSVAFYDRHDYEPVGKRSMDVGGGRKIPCMDMEKDLSRQSSR